MLFKKKNRKPIVQFLICGAQKSGTTALAEYLRNHQQLYLPDRKELHYFDDEDLNWRSPDHARYHEFFKDRGPKKICGEATPIYMYWDTAPLRIWQYNSDMRLIVILRNPISRAYSHWSMEKNRGQETFGFADAISQEEMRCRASLPQQHRIFSYVDRGFYTHQIRRLWRFFGRERVLILKQDELMSNPQTAINRVCEHLDVEQMLIPQSINTHVGKYDAEMGAKDHALLVSLLSREIRHLEDLLGWDCNDWLLKDA